MLLHYWHTCFPCPPFSSLSSMPSRYMFPCHHPPPAYLTPCRVRAGDTPAEKNMPSILTLKLRVWQELLWDTFMRVNYQSSCDEIVLYLVDTITSPLSMPLFYVGLWCRLSVCIFVHFYEFCSRSDVLFGLFRFYQCLFMWANANALIVHYYISAVTEKYWFTAKWPLFS